MRRHLDGLVSLAAPCLVLLAVAWWGNRLSPANEIQARNAIVMVAIVVALYVFVGNSGVISFGHASFVAVGAFVAGLMSIPLESKTGVLPDVYPFLRDHSYSNYGTLALAALAGGVFALVVGIPLMRLNGLAAGIATFAVLEITHNVLRNWTKIGRARRRSRSCPRRRACARARPGRYRDRDRLALPAQPPRQAAAGHRPRTRRRRRRPASACTASASGPSRSRARCPASRAACWCTSWGR